MDLQAVGGTAATIVDIERPAGRHAIVRSVLRRAPLYSGMKPSFIFVLTLLAASIIAFGAPAAAAPADCEQYLESQDSYPIARCESGYNVFNVQRYLIGQGYVVDVDGYFGASTEAAVRSFQSSIGLNVDGLVGPETWRRLLTEAQGIDANGNGLIDPWELVVGNSDGEVPEDTCDSYVENDRYPIRLCDKGHAVTLIQQALKAQGYAVQVDGVFGRATRLAVRQFQLDNELEVDALVGPQTWKALVPNAPGTDANGNGIVDPRELATTTTTTTTTTAPSPTPPAQLPATGADSSHVAAAAASLLAAGTAAMIIGRRRLTSG